MNKFSWLVLSVVLVACGSVAPSEDPCTCEANPEIPYTVEHCTQQDDGTCTDAGTYQGTDITALLSAFCPTQPTLTCNDKVLIVKCENKETEFRFEESTDAEMDAGAHECTIREAGK